MSKTGIAAIVLACAVHDARSQGGVVWQAVANGPFARFGTNLAYDPVRQMAVLFGGMGVLIFPPTPTPMQDTWEWTGNWTQRNPAASPPAGTCRLVYHGALGGIVAFVNNTAWLWNGLTWTARGVQPIAVASGESAYDTVRQVVVWAGAAGTWEWNGVTWTQRSATAPAGPMTYDEARGVMVVSGATTSEWNGTNWTQRNPATVPFNTPPAPGAILQRSQPVFDASRSRVIQHGAWGDPNNGTILAQETWEWSGTDWSRISTGGPARQSLMMVYDAVFQQTLVFGGSTSALTATQVVMDTMTLTSASLPVFNGYGSGCPGSNGWLTLLPVPFNLPWVGDTFTVEVGSLPNGCLPWLLIGFASTSLPVAGCTQLSSADAVVGLTASANHARYGLPIPATLGASVVGWSLYYQAVALAAGGAPPLGVAASQGGRAVLGLR